MLESDLGAVMKKRRGNAAVFSLEYVVVFWLSMLRRRGKTDDLCSRPAVRCQFSCIRCYSIQTNEILALGESFGRGVLGELQELALPFGEKGGLAAKNMISRGCVQRRDPKDLLLELGQRSGRERRMGRSHEMREMN